MTLADKAYDRIRRDIVTGGLPPDMPLRMDALKRRYGVGFSPLREALNRLQAERLVAAAPLRGFTVAPVSLVHMWDTIETRIEIETRALARAIEFGDDAWEADVASALHALSLQARRLGKARETSETDRQVLEDRHRAFHHSLISACRSAWLLDFANMLYVSAERYRYSALTGAKQGPTHRDVPDEHRQLAEAAFARDAEGATMLLEQHYRLTGEHLEQTLLDRLSA